MPYTPTLATLGYILSPDRERVLLVHRNRDPEHHHFGKYNGVGGKLESGEDVLTGMRREIREETGLECDAIRLRGTVSWPGFGKHGEDWFGFIFLIEKWHGKPFRENAEGELAWIEVARISELSTWEGDQNFLPLVFDLSDERQFHGVMPYRNGRPISWHVAHT